MLITFITRFEFFHKAAAKIPYHVGGTNHKLVLVRLCICTRAQNSSKRTDSFVIEMLSYQRYLCKLNHALALLRAEQVGLFVRMHVQLQLPVQD